MGFLSNFIRTSLTKKCPDGYKPAGVTKEGIVYYEKIKKGGEPEKLSTNDKKRIMVQRVTAEDMLQFPNIPYQLNCPIRKQLSKNSHPFAYMDLNKYNQNIAKKDLGRLDKYIAQARNYIPLLTKEYHIDINKVMYECYSQSYGYSRLMCEPFTFAGKKSKYPLSLFFMTRGDIRTYSASGELFYDANGRFGKAAVSIWTAPADYSYAGTGWIFTFKTIDKKFVLAEAKTTLRPDKYGQPTVIYKI